MRRFRRPSPPASPPHTEPPPEEPPNLDYYARPHQDRRPARTPPPAVLVETARARTPRS
ncbi:MAG TPA: hypothetical protein VFW71_04990 [Actinomycetota bacterium]|nr:hypothetical protein [Actinomycetota bacterium]